MNQIPPVFIRLQGKARGPFIPDQLKELIASGAVTRDSEAAVSPHGPWAPLQTLSVSAIVFARPLEFEVANPKSGPAVDHHALIAAANRPQGPGLSAAAPTAVQPPSAAHDVEEILRLNLEKERKHGIGNVVPRPPRKSARRRDFWITLAAGNSVLLGIGFASRSPPVLALFAALCVFYSVGVWWVMYQILGDY